MFRRRGFRTGLRRRRGRGVFSTIITFQDAITAGASATSIQETVFLAGNLISAGTDKMVKEIKLRGMVIYSDVIELVVGNNQHHLDFYEGCYLAESGGAATSQWTTQQIISKNQWTVATSTADWPGRWFYRRMAMLPTGSQPYQPRLSESNNWGPMRIKVKRNMKMTEGLYFRMEVGNQDSVGHTPVWTIWGIVYYSFVT